MLQYCQIQVLLLCVSLAVGQAAEEADCLGLQCSGLAFS